jgi:DNA-binding transcriptional ArsR family regulator
LRLKILNTLGDGEKSVGEIVTEVNSPQPNVSRHLSILVQAGIVSRRQTKNTVYCSIADKRIWHICELACIRPE